MPAKVTVQSGISAGNSHWIEQAVIRVGSDPRSDVCLPSADVPTHALTLEYRDGRYRVYNRCPGNIRLGSQSVPPGKASDWPADEILQLSQDIALVLEIDDDPTPVPVRPAAPAAYDLDEDVEPYMEDATSAAEEEAENASAADSKFLLQLAITIVCVLGCIGLLAREALQDQVRDREPPSFAAVVRQANASETTAPELVRRLQYAESAMIRGDTKAARTRFAELRDDLIAQRPGLLDQRRRPELEILDLVEYRLGQLE